MAEGPLKVDVLSEETEEVEGVTVKRKNIRVNTGRVILANAKARLWARRQTPPRTPSYFKLQNSNKGDGEITYEVVIVEGEETRLGEMKQKLGGGEI